MMKTLSYILLSVLLTSFGCKKKNLETNSSIEFALNKSQMVNSANVTVTNINDNRCPPNADCITAGKAEAQLSVKVNGETKDLTLCIGGDCNKVGLSDQQTFSVASVNYTVKLVEVNPYNTFEKAVVPKTVKLQVTKM
ncbi:hypothetical protein [Pedobacter sp. Leaf41]|jgi:hypothetical protein|uniref:hypothetical protein n=1 Tax=Pedobacter sp. Leaf41 TaxID=1736218 RepID=UPI000AF3D442|nr:hypothetical protein [Pedobacter sp. Leaf41]RZK67336.1 MAG: hypothetical protein EOO95_03225 [Pedobacter sp.]